MNWVLLPLKRYADFTGRSRRLEYWLFQLTLWVILIAFYAISEVLAVIALAALFLPALALQVRRFHDQDKSGWFVLVNAIPYLGGLIVLVMMCLPGTAGENRFGPDPLDPTRDLVDVFS